MNRVLEDILRTGYTKTVDGESIKINSNISREEGGFLQEIINELKPTRTLEIGLAYGVSALFICDALAKIPSARHVIIDPCHFEEGGRLPASTITLYRHS